MGAQQCRHLREELVRVEGGQLRNTEERGSRCVDLQTDLPCNSLPEAVAGDAVIGTAQKDLCLSKAADCAASLRMAGDSADKFAVAEDDSTTTATAVPERV